MSFCVSPCDKDRLPFRGIDDANLSAGQMRWQAKIKNKKIESEMKDLSKAADFSTCFLTSLQANLCIKPMAGYYVLIKSLLTVTVTHPRCSVCFKLFNSRLAENS